MQSPSSFSVSDLFSPTISLFPHKTQSKSFFNSTFHFIPKTSAKFSKFILPISMDSPLKCSAVSDASTKPIFDPHSINPDLVQNMAYDALVWSSLHGLLVGDRSYEVWFWWKDWIFIWLPSLCFIPICLIWIVFIVLLIVYDIKYFYLVWWDVL